MNNAFDQLIREADKSVQVPEQIATYANTLINGTHEITSVTIKPKRDWVGLTDDDVQDVIQRSVYAITDGSNTFTLSANKIWVAIVREVEAKLKEKMHDSR